MLAFGLKTNMHNKITPMSYVKRTDEDSSLQPGSTWVLSFCENKEADYRTDNRHASMSSKHLAFSDGAVTSLSSRGASVMKKTGSENSNEINE